MKYFLSLFILLIQVADLSSQHFHQEQLKKLNGDYYGQQKVKAENFFDHFKQEMALGDHIKMNLVRDQSLTQMTHSRYQQMYKDVPIFGNQVVLHQKDGYVVRTHGQYTPQVNMSVQPSISKEMIGKYAQRIYNAQKQSSKHRVSVDQANLVLIDQFFPQVSGNLKLAYQVTLTVNVPFDRTCLFIDAHSGEKLYSYSLIHANDVVGEGQTRYYGVQQIVSDSINPNRYELRDNSRGIEVLNQNGVIYKNTTSQWNLSAIDRDDVAIDAMYCSASLYDYWQTKYDWKGVDGVGMKLSSKIHNNGAGNVNAFWDGRYANFGDGDCTYGPLTTLDVLAHEFMHGVVGFTSGLIYSGESGALNESLADMMGKTLEYVYDQSRFTWKLGETFKIDPNAPVFRVMDDPKSMSMPAFYGGEFWIDNNDVHINSSIGNLWFAMLSDGRSGSTEQGVDFDVPQIGIEKAMAIAFYTNLNYCLPSTNYSEFSNYSVLVAEELFGAGSVEVEAVKEAWKAVGVKDQVTTIAKDLAVSINEFTTICGFEGFGEINFTVRNLGFEPYLASDNAIVELSAGGLPLYTVSLTEDILPGATKNFVVNDWLQFNGETFILFNVRLLYNDENNQNNEVLTSASFLPDTPLDLTAFMFDNGTNYCQSSTQSAMMYMTNASCVPIPAGSTIHCTMENASGELVHDSTFTLDVEMSNFDFLEYHFDFSVTHAGAELYYYRMHLEGDNNLVNNEGSIFIFTNNAIEKDYFQDFEDFDFTDQYIQLEGIFSQSILEHQGQHWVPTLSITSDTLQTEWCFGPNQRFESAFDKTTISSCVNFEPFEKATLEFDILAYINRDAEAMNNPNSVMVKVIFEGNKYKDTLLNNFQDGAIQSVKIDIPANYIGKVSIIGYTQLGNGSFSTEAFENYDVLLITNVEFKTNELSNKPSNQPLFVEAYPNPTTGNVRLTSYEDLVDSKYQIIDAFGKVQGLGVISKDEIQLSHLPAGIYWIQMLNQQGRQVIVKTIKQ